MAVRTDARPKQDMSFWLIEKADKAIEETARIIDILRSIKDKIPSAEKEQLDFWLRALLSHEIVISGLGHENWDFDQAKWEDLLVNEGEIRVGEFQGMISSKNSKEYEPALLPLVFESLINDIHKVKENLSNSELERSQIREGVLRLANTLKQIRLKTCIAAYPELFKLVDQNSATQEPILGWDEFIRFVSEYLGDLEPKILNEIREQLEPLV